MPLPELSLRALLCGRGPTLSVLKWAGGRRWGQRCPRPARCQLPHAFPHDGPLAGLWLRSWSGARLPSIDNWPPVSPPPSTSQVPGGSPGVVRSAGRASQVHTREPGVQAGRPLLICELERTRALPPRLVWNMARLRSLEEFQHHVEELEPSQKVKHVRTQAVFQAETRTRPSSGP